MSGQSSRRPSALGAAGRSLFVAVIVALVVAGSALYLRYGTAVEPLLGAIR
jgi:hypothetical protein